MERTSWWAASLFAIAAAAAGPAAGQEELRVGVIGNLSGVFAASGTTMVNGIRMAVDEAGGKAGNMPVKLFVVDDEGNPELAITRLKAMDTRDKVDVVVGPASGNIGMAAVDWAKDSGVPVVVAYSAPEDITMRKAQRNVVRAGWSGAQPMFAFGEYVAKKGMKKIVMVGQDYVFPHNQIGGFLKTFCRNGGEEVVKIWHPLNTTDFSSMLAVLPAGDAIMYNGAGSDGVAFAKQLDEFGARRGRPLLGGSNFFAVGSLPAMGKSAIGGLSALQYSDALDTPEFKKFRDAYMAKYNEPPMATSEHGYVAMKMVLNAVNETGGKDRAKLIDALRKTNMPDAPRGPVKLDDYGNPIQNIYINEVKEVGGKMLNVAIAKVENVSQFGPYDAKTYLADPPDSRDFPPGKCSDPYYKK
jgi:branched-chain amino acid transport system substrate-binding protein